MVQEERTVCFDKDLQIEAYRFKGILQKFPNHFHEYYVIGFIENGRRRLTCGNEEYLVGEGDLLLFNPFVNHTCESIDDRTLDYRCLNIKPEVMKKAVFEVTGKEFLLNFARPVGRGFELSELLRELHRLIQEKQADLKKEETFLFLIERLIDGFSNPWLTPIAEEVPSEIQSVCSYIEEHYARRITLDDISRLSGLNKFSLLRSFTKQKGITPYRYLETVRISEAKKLLEKGVEPIDAAFQTGFSDQSHFSRFFKEFIGLTPKQYRNIFTESKP